MDTNFENRFEGSCKTLTQVVMRDGATVARVHILTPVQLRAFERKGERWLGYWGVPRGKGFGRFDDKEGERDGD